jgi:hypothetical protein
MDNKMDDKELRKNLHQLHDEIKKTQAVDEKGRKLLRDLDGELRALLERSEETPMQVHPSIIQRLEGALDHFEVTHPDLTMLISRLLDSLSTAGI